MCIQLWPAQQQTHLLAHTYIHAHTHSHTCKCACTDKIDAHITHAYTHTHTQMLVIGWHHSKA